MIIDVDSEIGLVDKDKGDGVVRESKIRFRTSDLNVDAAIDDDTDFQSRGVVHHQQPQSTAVCWQRFLHVRSIRILLVENDDSTRHVVTALLRNCNYEVIEAANGLQAWKILEDLTNHIDIVLTEVVMPCVSGIALLCKIKNHKTRTSIPVIMMSCHDSVGLVFKCLSKGAVDFLVKPIRKNELKNLWQHVWRRCHSSSGSGSGNESGTQTQKSVKSKNIQRADNSGSDDGGKNGSNGLNAGDGSDDGGKNGSNGLNAGDGSDDGSGAQSSWTKRAVELDSSRSMSPIDQADDCLDSTIALVIRPNAENYKSVDIDVVRESQPDTVAKGKDLDEIISRDMEPKSENPMKIQLTHTGAILKPVPDMDCNTSTKSVDQGQLNLTKMSTPPIGGKESSRELDINNNAPDDSKEPNFELSLKRHRGVQQSSVQDDRRVLRHSEQSAFSRYNASSNLFKAPNTITGSSSIIGNSDIQAHSTDRLIYQSSNEGSNNKDMGSTTNKLRARPSVMKTKSETTSTVNGLHLSASRDVENNDLSRPIDGNLSNYSLNKSASGSNHGQNESSTVVNAVGTYKKGDFGQGMNSGSGDASGNQVDENKFRLREAALKKFRQKRKDRSFKKKVRYQARKRLAEQRPRVRGQFVKQTGTDSSKRSENG